MYQIHRCHLKLTTRKIRAEVSKIQPEGWFHPMQPHHLAHCAAHRSWTGPTHHMWHMPDKPCALHRVCRAGSVMFLMVGEAHSAMHITCSTQSRVGELVASAPDQPYVLDPAHKASLWT